MIHHRQHSRVRADAKRKHEYRRDGKCRSAQQRARGVRRVLRDRIDDARPLRSAEASPVALAAVGEKRVDVAELRERSLACGGGRQPFGDERLCFRIEMKAELVLELASRIGANEVAIARAPHVESSAGSAVAPSIIDTAAA